MLSASTGVWHRLSRAGKEVGGSLLRQGEIITKPKTANLASTAQSRAETVSDKHDQGHRAAETLVRSCGQV